MSARIYQGNREETPNPAENDLLHFLSHLPDGYAVYHELNISLTGNDGSSLKKTPDFIITGPDIGLLSIEVKDWNILHNTFVWPDQYTVIRRNNATDEQMHLKNPMRQADDYLHALMKYIGKHVFVESLLAFPRLTRSEFLNSIGDRQSIKDEQSKYYLDAKRILFRDGMEAFKRKPQELLLKLVKRNAYFRPSNTDALNALNDRLLPPDFYVGGDKRLMHEREHLVELTEKQQTWVRSLDDSQNYLLDVAGSGKTTVLVEKALYMIDRCRANNEDSPNILITTYNPNLQRNIERILNRRVKPEERNTIYRKLVVENVAYIMERIVVQGYNYANKEEYYVLNPPGMPDFSDQLREDVRNIMQDKKSKFRVFDYVLIDEIQDFDDDQIDLVRKLCRTNNFFFVGDVAQKLYNRQHTLSLHKFAVEPVPVEPSFTMYRTPRGIAQLAHRFLMKDHHVRKELEKLGYNRNIEYRSYSDRSAVLKEELRPVDEAALFIDKLLDAGRHPDEIMVITAEDLIHKFRDTFTNMGIPYRLGQPRGEGEVCIIDFMNVKGLEREVIIIAGIEELYDHLRDTEIYGDGEVRKRREGFLRRKLYVALTRANEECYVYFANDQNRFIKDMCEINREITGGLRPDKSKD